MVTCTNYFIKRSSSQHYTHDNTQCWGLAITVKPLIQQVVTSSGTHLLTLTKQNSEPQVYRNSHSVFLRLKGQSF